WECCPRDWLWFKGSCYHFSRDQKNWKSSRDACNFTGSHLVAITSKEEQDFIARNLDTVYWIGLSDQVKENDWRWEDGTP
uniref:C-type lectin domain-containing protein n=2 Tax=Latimeria chalumnae TaxID=7897 RepID=H3AKC3_LATCH